jgi:hypothetical protein
MLLNCLAGLPAHKVQTGLYAQRMSQRAFFWQHASASVINGCPPAQHSTAEGGGRCSSKNSLTHSCHSAAHHSPQLTPRSRGRHAACTGLADSQHHFNLFIARQRSQAPAQHRGGWHLAGITGANVCTTCAHNTKTNQEKAEQTQ